MRTKETNEIIEDHGDWLLIDISTPKHPEATMAVDTDVFFAHEGGRISASCGGASKYVYARYNYKEKSLYFHRDIIDVPDGMEIDHITHGTMSFVDNRMCNLRLATRTQNCMNKSPHTRNKSGVKGVCWNNETKKWVARIRVNGKDLYLGIFKDINDAVVARKQAEEKYFGEFAYYGGLK